MSLTSSDTTHGARPSAETDPPASTREPPPPAAQAPGPPQGKAPAEAAAAHFEVDHGANAERRARTAETFEQIARLPPDDPEAERLRLALVEEHMPFARRLARRYGGRGELAEDFLQVAYVGLVKAVRNFDPEHGTGFLGYATPVIIGEIKRYFRDATWDVHVPRSMQELSGTVRAATDKLTHQLGRSPTVAELAQEMNIDVEQATEALCAADAYNAASLDRPVGDGQRAAPLGDFLGGDDERYEAVLRREAVRPLLEGLREREKRILVMRFFEGMTQTEIAERIGVSQMQVSRLLAGIYQRLRTSLEDED